MADLAAFAVSWALGSVVWGVVLARVLYRRDPREGDNPGASGSFRTFGAGFGIAVGSLDLLKGYAAVRLAGALGATPLGLAGAAVGVVGGHCWPAWFGWRGGGGLATAAGAMLAFGPADTLLAIAIALAAAAAYKHPLLYGKLPMTALPFGALFGLPAIAMLFARAGNTPGLWAAAGATLVIGLRGLEMLSEKARRARSPSRRAPIQKGDQS
jgi:acyl-phosphate glycerol 3-phosphate acyltransferase